MIWRLCLVLALAPLPSFGAGDDLPTAAISPYAFAKFVTEHSNFEWPPLWNALHLKDQEIFLPPCEQSNKGVPSCTAELITVQQPDQILLLLEHTSSGFQVFLRYRTLHPGQWRFWGAWSPYVKYFPSDHHITHLGPKPLLVVTEQGNAGTGLSSKVESWIDLTRDRFESIFSFTREGHNVPFIEGIERNLWGGISAITTQPIERITVARSIQFNIVQRDHEKLALGTRTDRIVYVRSSDGTFQPDPTLSTATRHDLETFYDDLGSDFTPDEFLNFHHAALTTLAKSDNRAGRVWLTHFLEECKSTPLSRNLNTLLSHH